MNPLDRLATAIERLGPTIRRVNHYYLGRAICRVWGHRWRGGTVSCRSANDYQHCVRCWLEPPPIDWDAFHEEYPEYREEAPAGRERAVLPSQAVGDVLQQVVDNAALSLVPRPTDEWGCVTAVRDELLEGDGDLCDQVFMDRRNAFHAGLVLGAALALHDGETQDAS